MMRALAAAAVVALVLPAAGKAHWKPGKHNRVHAITWGFCGHQYKPCWRGNEAIRVARCEAGPSITTYAHNGQFLGMFQMGSWARAQFGHGWDPWTQAAAAYRYYRVSGWAPWECARIVGVR